jgi:hypothetical protein
MPDRSFGPRALAKVGLAILPGLSALFISSDLPWSLFSRTIADTVVKGGLIAVCILLTLTGIVRERRLAVWSFPALGILLFPTSGILLLVDWWVHLPFVEEANPIWHAGPFILVLFVLAGIAAFALCRICSQQRTRIPRLAWVLLGLVILVALADVANSTIADRSPDKWRAVLAVLPPIALKGVLILSPVAIGLPLARRNGLLAGLFVVAAEFVLLDAFFDPGYALGVWTSNQTIVKAVSVVPAIFFLVVSPIWLLCARSTRGRIWGLLLPVFIGLVSAEIISGSVHPYYSDIWLTRAIGAAEFLIALALAAVTYHWLGGQDPAAHSQDEKRALTERPTMVKGDKALYQT